MNYLESEFSNAVGSRKGLALAIDQFLVDNPLMHFTPTDLASRFGISDSKLRAIQRSINGLGTRSTGKAYSKSSVKGFMLYCLSNPNEGSNIVYVAAQWDIDPRTGKRFPVNPSTGKAWPKKKD